MSNKSKADSLNDFLPVTVYETLPEKEKISCLEEIIRKQELNIFSIFFFAVLLLLLGKGSKVIFKLNPYLSEIYKHWIK